MERKEGGDGECDAYEQVLQLDEGARRRYHGDARVVRGAVEQVPGERRGGFVAVLCARDV